MSQRFALLAVALAATCAPKVSPAAEVRKATHGVELTDRAGDVPPGKGGDVTSLALRSDGTHLTVAATLHEAPVGAQGAVVVKLSLDTDNQAGTGFQEGFEYEAELDSCVELETGTSFCGGATSTKRATRRYAVVFVRKLKADGTDRIRGLMDAPQTPIQDKVVEAKVAYADLGVKPGQTVRIAAREDGATGGDGPFPAVVLTLK